MVVDSGSTDRTPEICRAHGAQVHVTPDWPGHGPQKNRALDLATGEWILSADSDELITPALREEIERIVDGADPAPGYAIPRRSSICGRFMRHSGWWPDYVVRLFRRDAGRFTDAHTHERLIAEGAPRTPARADHARSGHRSRSDDRENERLLDRARADKIRGRPACDARGRSPHGTWAFFTAVLRAGFLDGREGFILAVANAEGSYYRYVKLMLLARGKRDS